MTNSISAPEGFGHLKMATHKLLAAIPSSPHLLAPSQLFPLSQTMPLCTIFAFSCGSHSRSHPGQAPPPPPCRGLGLSSHTSTDSTSPTRRGWPGFSSSGEVVGPTPLQEVVGPTPPQETAATQPLPPHARRPRGPTSYSSHPSAPK